MKGWWGDCQAPGGSSVIINIFLSQYNDCVRGLSYFTIYASNFKTLIVRWAGGLRVFYSDNLFSDLTSTHYF